MSTTSLLSKLANRTLPKLVRTRPASIPEQAMLSIVDEQVTPTGTDVLNYVRQEYKYSLNHDNRWSLFDQNSPNYTPAGSIVTVRYKESLTGQSNTFTGFLLASRRNTATPTIIVRAEVSGTYVEQIFSIFSPSVESIKCDRKATCLYGRKVYWIRDNPKWQSRFFTPPDQKVTIKKVRAKNRELRALKEQELAAKNKPTATEQKEEGNLTAKV